MIITLQQLWLARHDGACRGVQWYAALPKARVIRVISMITSKRAAPVSIPEGPYDSATNTATAAVANPTTTCTNANALACMYRCIYASQHPTTTPAPTAFGFMPAGRRATYDFATNTATAAVASPTTTSTSANAFGFMYRSAAGVHGTAWC
jgi:hypothetical protein